MMILVRWVEHALDVPVQELGKKVPANLTTEYAPMGLKFLQKYGCANLGIASLDQ